MATMFGACRVAYGPVPDTTLLAFHDNGDDVKACGVQSINTLRDYFIYGVSNHDVQMYAETGTSGFTSLIKAYDRDTTQIKFKLRTRKNLSQPDVILQSQHAPAVQATPHKLIGIDLDINNQGTSGLGPAVGFEYYRDAVLQSTSTAQLWTGIRLRGVHEQAPVVSTTQDTPAARATLNTRRSCVAERLACFDLQPDWVDRFEAGLRHIHARAAR